MKRFLKENKIFLVIIVGALIVWAAVYFSPKKTEELTTTGGEQFSVSCEDIPELPDLK